MNPAEALQEWLVRLPRIQEPGTAGPRCRGGTKCRRLPGSQVKGLLRMRTARVQCNGWHHWLNGHESEQTLVGSEGQRGLACCSLWGRKESDTTGWLSNSSSADVLSKRLFESHWFSSLKAIGDLGQNSFGGAMGQTPDKQESVLNWVLQACSFITVNCCCYCYS